MSNSTAEAHLSIGDIASATGISVDTIRVWERRYGRPQPVRLPSGHRRYTRDHVRWLRRVAEALARGHRAGAAVRADDAELERLLAGDQAKRTAVPEVQELLGLVTAYDRPALLAAFEKDWAELEPLAFLEERVGPLVTAVGRAWADGELDVRHEHFLTEVVQDQLRMRRSGFDVDASAPAVVLTTLPGETHGLGLQMSGMVSVIVGVRPHILGTDTPLEEIVRAARETDARAIAISVSLATGGVGTDREVAALRKQTPEEVRILIGGRGARGVRRGPRGVEYVDGLPGLARTLEQLVA